MDLTWHHFVPSSDDDLECSTCGVAISDDALAGYSNLCPEPSCTDDGNLGPCVFVPGERGPSCAYCERPGCKDHGERDEDDEDEAA